MGSKRKIQSDFEDLHPAEDAAEEDFDLEVDFDQDNPIVKAYLDGEKEKGDDWEEPKKDDEEGEEKTDDSEDEDEDPELEGDDEGDDEGEDADEDEEPEDEEEDGERYGRKVRKRIARERNLRQEAENRASKFEQRLARVENQFEVTKDEDEYRGLETDTNKKLAKLRKAKKEAIEEGETDKQIDLDDEILELRAELKARKFRLDQRREDAKKVVDEQPDVDTSDIPEAAKSWIRKYPEFRTNTKFYRAVLNADKTIAATGEFDKNATDYYGAMEAMLKPLFPAIIKRRSKRKAKVTNKRPRSPVGGTGKAGVKKVPGKRSGQVRLTVADQENMRVFGLDPKNKDHVKEYAMNKQD